MQNQIRGGHIAYRFDQQIEWWTFSAFKHVKKTFYFVEVQQYGHPGDEDKNFWGLCLIDVSIIAIHVFGEGGGGGGSIWDGPFDLWYD